MADHHLESLLGAVAHIGPGGSTNLSGGYLLGLRECPEGLLSGIPWSTGETCRATIGQLAKACMCLNHN